PRFVRNCRERWMPAVAGMTGPLLIFYFIVSASMRRAVAICEHAADAAARIGHVAAMARDQVDMDMQARLPGGAADVDADIIAVRAEFGLDMRLGPIEQGQHGGLLPPAHIKEA